jgi:hypothetical protein
VAIVALQLLQTRERAEIPPDALREIRLSDFEPVPEAKPVVVRRTAMRIVSLCLLSAALCPAYQVIQSGSGSKDGAGFRYETRVEPRIEGQKVIGFSGGGIHVRDRFHRYLQDDATRRYVGYDLTLNRRPDRTLVVTLGELSLSGEKLGSRAHGRRFVCA